MMREHGSKFVASAFHLFFELLNHSAQRTEFRPPERMSSYATDSTVTGREKLDGDFQYVRVRVCNLAIPDGQDVLVELPL